jgi:hypothetical protein
MRNGTPTVRRLGALIAVTGLVVACGGSDDGNSSDTAASPVETEQEPRATDPPTGTETATGEEPDEDPAARAEPVEGVLVSLLSVEFGLFDVARRTGDHRELTIEGLGYTDRERQPILALDGSTAYTLTYTPLEGQQYSHDVGVAAFDRTTGEGRLVTSLGIDRTDDEAADLTSYEILGADEDTVWVMSHPFAESDPNLITYTSYDVGSGEEIIAHTGVVQQASAEGSECEASVRSPFLDSAGGLMAVSVQWPVAIDPATGEVTPLLAGCLDVPEPTLATEVGNEAAEMFMVVENDRPLEPETVQILADAVRLSVAAEEMVEGDGSLWWVFNQNVSTFAGTDPVNVLAGGVVRFDLATRQIADVWPLGEAVGEWLPGDESAGSTGLSQPQLQYLDGSLWIMDHRDNRPLLRVDATTGAVTEVAIEAGAGFDRVTAELIPNDPEAIWLDVTRWVTTHTEDGGTSSSGEGFIDQVDIADDEIVLTVSQRDIIGF